MLKKRLCTAIPLIALVLLAFLLPGTAGEMLFAAFAALMLCLAVQEGFTLLPTEHNSYFVPLTMLYGTALLSLEFLAAGSPAARYFLITAATTPIVSMIFLLLAFGLVFHIGPTPDAIRALGSCLTVAFYLCGTLIFMPKVYLLPEANGGLLLLFMVTVTKMSDIGGYFIGSATARRPAGNHKLAKVVSPKKSWEGFIGGILFSLAAAFLFVHFGAGDLYIRRLTLDWRDALFLGLAAPVVGLLGDLAESALKRASGVKDSGVIPGLGGVLDTLDSLILVTPLFYGWLLFRAYLH